MGKQIYYAFDDSGEPTPRVQDAILFRELSRQLGDRLIGDDIFTIRGNETVWGKDRHMVLRDRQERNADAYLDPGAMEMMGGRVTDARWAQEVIDTFSESGVRATIRNLARPNRSLRHMSVGDRFESHRVAVCWDSDEEPKFLIHPSADLFPRLFLIVDNRVVTHSPMSYDEDAPLLIPPEDLRLWTSEDVFSDLSRVPVGSVGEEAFHLQAALVEDLLSRVNMPHGAVEVAMRREPNGNLEPAIAEIDVGPPGAVPTFWADAADYAAAVRLKLRIIDPWLGDEDPEPDD